MKILHIPFTYHPDPVGGTEVYVESLVHHLAAEGIGGVVAAPSTGGAAAYDHRGVHVRRFAVSATVRDAAELYGMRCETAAAGFAAVLDAEQPDVVHLHALTRGVSPAMAAEAKRRGIPVVFTYHTPAASCQRGTLLEEGSRVCDGALSVGRCSACSLQALGVPRLASVGLGRTPARVGALVGRMGGSSGPWTALRMTELMGLRHGAFREMLGSADRVVAVCAWVHDLLLRNGVPREKVVLSRQGVPGTAAPAARGSETRAEGALRLAFFGRLDPIKGPDTVLRALAAAPELDARLDVFGVPQEGEGRAYSEELRRLAGGDTRIHFIGPIAGSEVVRTLRGYDFLVVPSRCLETGPLVVLEAFAAGTPVIGSALGGIAELVRDGVDGLLVPPDAVGAWAAALLRAPSLRSALRESVRPPRTMADAAGEMAELYRHVLSGAASVPT